jgi:hypothetical protein
MMHCKMGLHTLQRYTREVVTETEITTCGTMSELRQTQQVSTQSQTTSKTSDCMVVQMEINFISTELLKIPKIT